MPPKRHVLLYTILLVTAGLCTEALAGSILFFSRESFIQLVINLTRRPYLLATLQNTIITPQKFALLKTAGITLLLVNPLLIAALLYYRRKVLQAIRFAAYSFASACKSVIQVYKNNTRADNILIAILLLAVAIRSLYYITYFNLQYDEMWSYNYFTSRPFYLSFFTHNNYPLFGLVTQLFKWLPFSMQVNLRLPCMLAGLVTCVVLYACIKQYTGNILVAFAGLAVFACMPVTVIYMLLARGVIFEIFFAVVSTFCALYILRGNNIKKYALLYVAANVLGLYSMPTHIYFMLVQAFITFVYTALYRKQLVGLCITANLLAAVLGVACYVPVLLGSGLSFLLQAKPHPAFATRNWPGLVLFTNNSARYLTGSVWGVIVLLTATIITAYFFRKRRPVNMFFVITAAALFYAPTSVYIIQGFAIPERALGFVGLAVPLCFCLIFYGLYSTRLKYILYTALLAICITGNVISYGHFRWSEDNDRKAVTITNLLLQHNVASCYDSATSSNFYYFYPALEYYYSLKGKTINLYTAAPNSLRSATYNVKAGYDCSITNIDFDTTRMLSYKVAYTDTTNRFIILLKK